MNSDGSSTSSNVWLLVAMSCLAMLCLISQLTETHTCYKIPGCMTVRRALGPGISGFTP